MRSWTLSHKRYREDDNNNNIISESAMTRAH